MTYCTAIKLKDGLIFASDTRTNAGIDHISTFRKLSHFESDDRVIVVQTSGNLATSQAVLNRLNKDIEQESDDSLLRIDSLFEAATIIGRYSCETACKSKTMACETKGFSSSFLVGGQIKGQEPELFSIYPEGNFIEASEDTHFFQIGESKYGKPILDRSLSFHSSMDDALRAVLVSFDSTIRSNLSVGFPIDLVTYKADSFKAPQGKRIQENDPFYSEVRDQWSEGLKSALGRLPKVPEDYWA